MKSNSTNKSNRYDIWEYPETRGRNFRGTRRDLWPEKSRHSTMKGAARFFSRSTGWNAAEIVPSGDLNHTEFYHVSLGYVGGIHILEENLK